MAPERGGLSLSDTPDATAWARLFDWLADRYDRQSTLISAGFYPRWLDQASELAALGHPAVVLDLGCGTGTFLARLRRRLPAAHLYGVDRSAGMLRHARRRLPDATFIQSELTDRLEDVPRADVVTMTFVLREQEHPARALVAARRHLHPGGRLVILETQRPRGPAGVAFDAYVVRGLSSRMAERLLTRDWPHREAPAPYAWLGDSQRRWGRGDGLTDWLTRAGFDGVRYERPLDDVVQCVTAEATGER